MKRTHLGVQAAIVLAMVAFVSWPHYRAARAQSVWRYAPDAVLQARANDAAQYSDAALDAARLAAVRAVHAEYDSDIDASNSNAHGRRTGDDTTVFGAVAAAGGKLNALLGFARTALNVPIPYARVLLRNIRTGQIVGRATADAYGQFSFLDLDSNSYIVELLGADGAVIATSPMVSMLVGDVRRTEVRTAAAAGAVTASLGNSLAATAPQATSIASESGVTRTTAEATPQLSTRH